MYMLDFIRNQMFDSFLNNGNDSRKIRADAINLKGYQNLREGVRKNVFDLGYQHAAIQNGATWQQLSTY